VSLQRLCKRTEEELRGSLSRAANRQPFQCLALLSISFTKASFLLSLAMTDNFAMISFYLQKASQKLSGAHNFLRLCWRWSQSDVHSVDLAHLIDGNFRENDLFLHA